MPGKKFASIKNPAQYEALRRKGFSKERAARIANTDNHATHSTSAHYEGYGSLDLGRFTSSVNGVQDDGTDVNISVPFHPNDDMHRKGHY